MVLIWQAYKTQLFLKVWYLFLTLLLLGCQSRQATDQKATRVKTFDSAFGSVEVDLNTAGEVLITAHYQNLADTILFWKEADNVTSIWDVKLYPEKCIVIVAFSYNIIVLYILKRIII